MSLNFEIPKENNKIDDSSKGSKTTVKKKFDDAINPYTAAIFLGGVTGMSAIIGFASTLAVVKKKDPQTFNEGVMGVKGMSESGASLAMRALGWGTLYAVTGCGILFYGIWKLSGATNAKEFRYKMGSLLPRIPKNDPPQSRTEFEGLTDLLQYVSNEWGKEKPTDSDW